MFTNHADVKIYVFLFYLYIATLFIGRFRKITKAAISFVMSARPSARNNLVPTGWNFMKFGILKFFRKPVDKIQVSLKLGNIAQ